MATIGVFATTVTSTPLIRLWSSPNVSAAMDVQVRESLTEKGFSLIETMVALALVVVVAAGMLPLGVVALSTSENQGHLSSRVRGTPRTKWNSCWRFVWGFDVGHAVFPLRTWEAAG